MLDCPFVCEFLRPRFASGYLNTTIFQPRAACCTACMHSSPGLRNNRHRVAQPGPPCVDGTANQTLSTSPIKRAIGVAPVRGGPGSGCAACSPAFSHAWRGFDFCDFGKWHLQLAVNLWQCVALNSSDRLWWTCIVASNPTAPRKALGGLLLRVAATTHA